MQHTDSILIVQRFFTALDYLKASGVIHGLSVFYDRYGINRRNAHSLRVSPSRHYFQSCWLTYLVRDYGVSPTWLLTGEGDMMAKK